MKPPQPRPLAQRTWHKIWVVLGSSGSTLACFLVLPLIQAIQDGQKPDTLLPSVDSAVLPPPPPPVEEEEIEEPEPEPEPPAPEFQEDMPLLDLAALEIALEGGGLGGIGGADFGIDLGGLSNSGQEIEELFSLAELDQEPRLLYDTEPVLDGALRRRSAGQKVTAVFQVDKDGRVRNVKVLRSDDPAFDRAAVACIEKWKFEPGMRGGKPVAFRMRRTIRFPAR